MRVQRAATAHHSTSGRGSHHHNVQADRVQVHTSHWQETWQEWADTNPVWGRAPLSSVLFAMKAVLRMSAVFVFRFVVTAPIKYPAGLVSWCSLTASPGFLVQICRALTELARAQHRAVKTNLPILLDIIMEQILIHISPGWTWTLAILPPS